MKKVPCIQRFFPAIIKYKRRDRMGKIKKVYIIFFLLAGLLFIGLFLRLDGRKKDIVMWIGEIPVYRTEFEEAMKEEYANTCGYFSRTYGASIDENFWHMEYDGITPLNYLKEKTGEKLIEEKMIQLVGLELGMEIETGYENRMVNWKGENEARRRAAAANQPVYGPIQLEWRQYKMDVQGDLIQNIKNKLYENKTFSKAEMDTYYEAHKESYFKNPGDYTDPKQNGKAADYAIEQKRKNKLGFKRIDKGFSINKRALTKKFADNHQKMS